MNTRDKDLLKLRKLEDSIHLPKHLKEALIREHLRKMLQQKLENQR